MIKHFFVITILIISAFTKQSGAQKIYQEPHRPQIHFSPKANWMNDPNGLVYYKGTYHMFFQYYPDSTVWGPNYWGHATSKDLIHWTEWAPALAPDTLGLIASGSAVADFNNTSGFGKDGKIPLVAIFTHIGMKENKWTENSQVQSLAYSLDEGKSWVKYANNPVIKNPGIKDFRDPKVIWYKPQSKWVMTAATGDHVTYYSSLDLKNWKKESEFGKGVGAHGGVWECPDLISFEMDGKKVWVQLVSINPGGPNGGSATQYFVGDFDGTTFTPFSTDTKWVDYGTDNYAGVTWSNMGNRKLFLGWMSNWQYATIVPTVRWRSAMTVPRELKLKKLDNSYLVSSLPVKELDKLKKNTVSLKNIAIKEQFDLSKKIKELPRQYQINLIADQAKSFSIVLSNNLGEQVIVGYSKEENAYYINRTKSGKTDFEKGFAKRITGPRLSKSNNLNIKLLVDVASVELFADDGLTVMTGIFFPNKTFNTASVSSPDALLIKELRYSEMESIWDSQFSSSKQIQSNAFDKKRNINTVVKNGSTK